MENPTILSEILIDLQHCDIVLNDRRVLSDITWSLRTGENWGVFGGNGSGKTTFLRLVRGNLWPATFRPGRRLYRVDGDMQPSPVGLREKIGYVSPEQQDEYLRRGWMLTCRDAVATGLFDTPLLYGMTDTEQNHRVDEALKHFHLQRLADNRFRELSRGEMRRALLARAWVMRPHILILDECCHGLDSESREQILSMIEGISQTGVSILYAGHRVEEIPRTLTHALWMKQGCIERTENLPSLVLPSADVRDNSALLKDFGVDGKQTSVPDDYLIHIENVQVWYWPKPVLHDINWTMRPDENWGIVGPNGSGKSTLLKLIAGDLWPELGGSIHRFNHGEDLTVLEAKQRIGVVSAELQAMYTYDISALEVVVSGLFGSVGLYSDITPEQWDLAQQMMRDLWIESLADKPIRSLSYGELRKVLIARALIHKPDLLILDEPFDGLDAASHESISQTVDVIARKHARVILVTHHAKDLLPCITHVLEMREGRIGGVYKR